MSRPNYYDILGVSSNASADDITRAYRQRAFERHPDRNPNDPSAATDMQQIAEAAALLRDPQKRSEYDRTVRRTYQPAAARRTAPSPAPARCSWEAGDVEYTIRISFAEAQAGVGYPLRFHNAQGLPYEVVVMVQPGTTQGARIVVPGAGGPARDGSRRGDLIVIVEIVA